VNLADLLPRKEIRIENAIKKSDRGYATEFDKGSLPILGGLCVFNKLC
jgi:hypothetical protein